jgi:hypothetical protein
MNDPKIYTAMHPAIASDDLLKRSLRNTGEENMSNSKMALTGETLFP